MYKFNKNTDIHVQSVHIHRAQVYSYKIVHWVFALTECHEFKSLAWELDRSLELSIVLLSSLRFLLEDLSSLFVLNCVFRHSPVHGSRGDPVWSEGIWTTGKCCPMNIITETILLLSVTLPG